MPADIEIENINFQNMIRASKTQANPVSADEYIVLDFTNDVEIMGIASNVTWTVQPSPLEIHIYINGVKEITHAVSNPVSGTVYYAVKAAWTGLTAQTLIATIQYIKLWPRLKNVKITVETTGGTVQQVQGRVIYAKG